MLNFIEFLYSLEIYLIEFRKRGWERGRETLINCFQYPPRFRIEPAT